MDRVWCLTATPSLSSSELKKYRYYGHFSRHSISTMKCIEVVKVSYRMKWLEMFGVPVMTRLFSWLILTVFLKTCPPNKTTGRMLVFLTKVFKKLIKKRNEKKTSSHIMTFSRTYIKRKSPVHRWIEQVRQERPCNTKLMSLIVHNIHWKVLPWWRGFGKS